MDDRLAVMGITSTDSYLAYDETLEGQALALATLATGAGNALLREEQEVTLERIADFFWWAFENPEVDVDEAAMQFGRGQLFGMVSTLTPDAFASWWEFVNAGEHPWLIVEAVQAAHA